MAEALSRMKYRDTRSYNMFSVWWLTVTQSTYVSYGHMVRTYLPFMIIVGIVIAMFFLMRGA